MKRQLVLVVSLAACGGGSDGEFDDVAASMEGVYEIDAFTRNEAACAPGGESALGEDGFAVVFRQEFFGQKFLSLMSCASIAECQALPARVEAGDLFAVDFSFGASEVGGDGTLLGRGASTGFNENGTCTLGEVTATTFALAGGELTIEEEITIADDYPASADGFCDTTSAQEAAAGNTCSQLALVSATFVAPL